MPDRASLKGKRDYAILSVLLGCGLRRAELVGLDVSDLQMRENRWVLADLRGKGGRVRTVAVPLWVKGALNAWQTAAGVEEGKLFRRLGRGARVRAARLGAGSVRAVVEQSAHAIGIEGLGAHDLRRTRSGREISIAMFLAIDVPNKTEPYLHHSGQTERRLELAGVHFRRRLSENGHLPLRSQQPTPDC